MTTAGIHGTVREIHETTLRLEIAPGVVVTLARGAVSQRRRPSTIIDSDGPDSPGEADASSIDGTGLDGTAVEPRQID